MIKLDSRLLCNAMGHPGWWPKTPIITFSECISSYSSSKKRNNSEENNHIRNNLKFVLKTACMNIFLK